MSKIAIINSKCVRELTLEARFLKELENMEIGKAKNLQEADYLLYITCAGVGDVIKKELGLIYDLIYHINEERNDLKLIIAGCLTKLNPLLCELKKCKNIKIIEDRDWVIPVTNYLLDHDRKNDWSTKLDNRTKYILENNSCVQFFLSDGCINHCSFCKTNYLTNKYESVPYELAIEHLKKLIHNGCFSITLSGDNTTTYGIDLYGRCRLHEFINELSKEEKLKSINLFEITANNMYPELLEEILNNPKVKNICIQLESASNNQLLLMNRGHDLEKYDFIVKKLKEKGKFVNTILMSGFPNETYDDLDFTIEYLKSREIVADAICEYVDFQLIPSHNLEQLPYHVKKQHTRYLKEGIKRNNITIQKERIKDLDHAVLAGTIGGYHVFANDSTLFGISKCKKYSDIEIGTVIQDKPKSLIYKSNFNGTSVYRY